MQHCGVESREGAGNGVVEGEGCREDSLESLAESLGSSASHDSKTSVASDASRKGKASRGRWSLRLSSTITGRPITNYLLLITNH